MAKPCTAIFKWWNEIPMPDIFQAVVDHLTDDQALTNWSCKVELAGTGANAAGYSGGAGGGGAGITVGAGGGGAGHSAGAGGGSGGAVMVGPFSWSFTVHHVWKIDSGDSSFSLTYHDDGECIVNFTSPHWKDVAIDLADPRSLDHLTSLCRKAVEWHGWWMEMMKGKVLVS